ncbi:hypothetical protein H8S21_21660 [Erwinia persicina]|uniref:hypothetical protein n=1 Tax=Erwinia persicina TaxID=55211 RepID=UPI00165435C9|nr:hypothetical protein [Erwinia persicina]MBC3947931.1 hypothetical protein [Erwinia persicina]
MRKAGKEIVIIRQNAEHIESAVREMSRSVELDELVNPAQQPKLNCSAPEQVEGATDRVKTTMRDLSERTTIVKGTQYGDIVPAVTLEQKMFCLHLVNNAESNPFL